MLDKVLLTELSLVRRVFQTSVISSVASEGHFLFSSLGICNNIRCITHFSHQKWSLGFLRVNCVGEHCIVIIDATNTAVVACERQTHPSRHQCQHRHIWTCVNVFRTSASDRKVITVVVCPLPHVCYAHLRSKMLQGLTLINWRPTNSTRGHKYVYGKDIVQYFHGFVAYSETLGCHADISNSAWDFPAHGDAGHNITQGYRSSVAFSVPYPSFGQSHGC